MWIKNLQTTVKNSKVQVAVFMYKSEEYNGRDSEVVRVQSMLNEYYLMEDIRFENRDSAYDFIEHYPVSMAKAFVIREAYNTGAFDANNE